MHGQYGASLVPRPSSGHGWSAHSGGWGTREREGLAKNIATFRSSSPQIFWTVNKVRNHGYVNASYSSAVYVTAYWLE